MTWREFSARTHTATSRSAGTSSVLYHVSGPERPWAQNPPHYTEVVAFEADDKRACCHYRFADWRDWQRNRRIYSHHDGHLIIVTDFDSAHGLRRHRAALVVHLIGEGKGRPRRRGEFAGTRAVEVMPCLACSDGIRLDFTEESRGSAEVPEV